MDFQQAYSFLIPELEHKLPAFLTYHNANHTKDVIQNAQHIAAFESICDDDLQILLTAALFHDAGFLNDINNHEENSCRIARKHLGDFHYSPEEIEKIEKLILATRWPQKPSDKLEEILCDADSFYVGTNRYFQIADNLYRELRETGKLLSRNEWHLKQISFLETHTFYTGTAIKEGSEHKQKNLNLLKYSKKPARGEKKSELVVGIQDFFLILSGILISAFALKGFLVPNHFFDGGITGISLLLHEIYHFDLAITVILINTPLIVVSMYMISRAFALKTFGAVILLGICLSFFPYPVITSDKLLISIFGGFFLGAGVGLIMRAGGALDGIEILALYTLKRTSFTIAEIIFGINLIIFSIAAFEFGLETALYSILTYFTATRTIDYVVEGIEAYTGVTIISANSEMIKHRLVKELGRAITVYKGERGYLPEQFEVSDQCDIIFTVISRLELRKLKNLVNESDPKAFVFANTIKEALGGVIKRRHAH